MVQGRSSGGITHHKQAFAHDAAETADFEAAVELIKPTGIIGSYVICYDDINVTACTAGVAAQPGVFTENV